MCRALFPTLSSLLEGPLLQKYILLIVGPRDDVRQANNGASTVCESTHMIELSWTCSTYCIYDSLLGVDAMAFAGCTLLGALRSAIAQGVFVTLGGSEI